MDSCPSVLRTSGSKDFRRNDRKCYAKRVNKFILLLGILAVFLPVSVFAATTPTDSLYQINQKVCDRFEEDISKLAAIMEELRRRQGITETRVAFGGVDTEIESADYQVTYAAEALAFQRAQKFSSKAQLRNNLEVLRGKILRAKREVGEALDEK